jgi:hypothetical protein
LRKIYGTNFFHLKFGVVVASNVKIDQCCPQLRFLILMVRLYRCLVGSLFQGTSYTSIFITY